MLDTPGTLAIKIAALKSVGVRGVSWWHTGSVKYGTADGQADEMWGKRLESSLFV